MSNQELAEWFGIKISTLRNCRQKKLKELQEYADFTVNSQNIIINKIYDYEYVKKESRAYKIIKENFHKAWHKSGYDTAARVATQIYNSNEELRSLITIETAKNYVLKARKEFYGRVVIEERGTRGTCKYEYIKQNQWEEALLLTEEEKAKVKEIIKNIYYNEQEPLIYQSLKQKEISEDDYAAAMKEWNSPENRQKRFERFVKEVSDVLGYFPDKVTQLLASAF